MLKTAILLVGNDQQMVTTLRHQLGSYDYNIVVSPDSKSAVPILDGHRPALVLFSRAALAGDDMELLQRIISQAHETVFVLLTPEDMLDVGGEIQFLLGETVVFQQDQLGQLGERQF